MSDKKSPPDEQKTVWDDPTPGGSHNKTYYGGARSGEPDAEDEICPIDEQISAAPPPKSQALLDIQEAGLTPEEAARASEELAAAEEQPTGKKAKAPKTPKGAASRSGVENLVVIARFRWIFLLVLALISVAAWTAEAFVSDRPYNWEAAAWLGLTLLLVLPTMKFLRLPTISGLAALFWAGSYLISALYGPPETLFGNIPAALNWAGLLTLIVLWMGVAIWRKLGRYRVIDLILALVLIYAALAPVAALVGSISSGAALSLSFAALGSSPAVLTEHLPFILRPMTIVVAVILPLCALFSLWDQFSAFRRRGARHGGNFFLALAFIVLLPYAFLSYDQAVDKYPQLARDIRSIWPAASEFARETQPLAPALSDQPGAAVQTPAAVPPPAPLVETSPAPAPVLTPPENEAPLPAMPPLTSPEPDPAPLESAPATIAPETAAPVVAAPPAPVQPPAREAVEPPVTPATPVVVPSLEERLQSTDERLEKALTRIEDLEREIKRLKQGEAPDDAMVDRPFVEEASPVDENI